MNKLQRLVGMSCLIVTIVSSGGTYEVLSAPIHGKAVVQTEIAEDYLPDGTKVITETEYLPDGTKVVIITRYMSDQTRVVTETRDLSDGTKVNMKTFHWPNGAKYSIEEKILADGTKVLAVIELAKDGSKRIAKTEDSLNGMKRVMVTSHSVDKKVTKSITRTKADGSVITFDEKPDGSSVKTLRFTDERTKATTSIIIRKDQNDTIGTEVNIKVQGIKIHDEVRILLTGALLNDIRNEVGMRDITVNVDVMDEQQNQSYHLRFRLDEIKDSEVMNVYRYDKTDSQTVAKITKAVVSQWGSIMVTLPVLAKDEYYEFVTQEKK